MTCFASSWRFNLRQLSLMADGSRSSAVLSITRCRQHTVTPLPLPLSRRRWRWRPRIRRRWWSRQISSTDARAMTVHGWTIWEENELSCITERLSQQTATSTIWGSPCLVGARERLPMVISQCQINYVYNVCDARCCLASCMAMALNCIHIFIVTGSFLYWCILRPASQRFFIHSCIYLRISIISYLATFLGTNSLSVLMCRKAVNQSIFFTLLPQYSDHS